MEEPGRLQSMESQRVGNDSVTSLTHSLNTLQSITVLQSLSFMILAFLKSTADLYFSSLCSIFGFGYLQLYGKYRKQKYIFLKKLHRKQSRIWGIPQNKRPGFLKKEMTIEKKGCWVSEWVKSLSRFRLFETPWTVAYQAPPSIKEA